MNYRAEIDPRSFGTFEKHMPDLQLIHSSLVRARTNIQITVINYVGTHCLVIENPG